MMKNEEPEETPNYEAGKFRNFLALFILGFFILFVGVIILMAAAIIYGGGSANFGAVIFIGPFPIVIGAGPQATWMVLFGIILAVLSVLMFVIMRRRPSGSSC
ncbi:MAG: TIGR00304 family membrane protein [Candidatus Bathycorpusculaceae bacterium]